MAAVAQQPVSVGIQANEQAFQMYSGGVLTEPCGSDLDHGVLVVGYGTDPVQGKYWKIKNSWGPHWGENGYIRIARGGAPDGQCGILLMPSYPVMSVMCDPQNAPLVKRIWYTVTSTNPWIYVAVITSAFLLLWCGIGMLCKGLCKGRRGRSNAVAHGSSDPLQASLRSSGSPTTAKTFSGSGNRLGGRPQQKTKTVIKDGLVTTVAA